MEGGFAPLSAGREEKGREEPVGRGAGGSVHHAPFEVSLSLRTVSLLVELPEEGWIESWWRKRQAKQQEEEQQSLSFQGAAAVQEVEAKPALPVLSSVVDERIVYDNDDDDSQHPAVVGEDRKPAGQAGRGPRRMRVLNDVSIDLQPGKLYALMGPSGAGKTSLLHVLSNHTHGRVGGQVLCNGREGLPNAYRSLCCVVPQDDVLLAALTPRESLRFMAELRLPQSMPREQKHARVEVVLNLLSLQQCAETRVGNVDERGISGGERKRVSIALEMVINPSILLLDEPTSGLDSHLAEEVVSMLASLAHGTDRGGHGAALHSDVDADADTVVAPTSTPGSGGGQGARRLIVSTIHQPSFKILCEFDWLTLLTRGRVAYNGPTAELAAYFSSIGHAPPTYENPCDFVMRVLQDPVEIPKCIEAWSAVATTAAVANGKAGVHESVNDASAPPGWDAFVAQPKHYATSRWYQFQVLMNRTMTDAMKDQNKFLGGVLLKIAVGIVVGSVWFDQAADTNAKIFTTTGSLFMMAMSSSLDTLMREAIQLPQTKSLLLREHLNGAYSLPPFFCAQLIVHSFFHSVCGIFLTLPIVYMVGLEDSARHIFLFLLVVSVMTCIGVALGLFIGSLVNDFQGAQQLVLPTIVPLTLSAGYVITFDSMEKWMKGIYWASFFQYGYSNLVRIQYEGMDFTDCEPVPVYDQATAEADCGTDDVVNIPLSNITCPVSCYDTGDEYLDHSNVGTLSKNFLALAGMFIGVSVVAYYILKTKIKLGLL